jgi:hypothetical protein
MNHITRWTEVVVQCAFLFESFFWGAEVPELEQVCRSNEVTEPGADVIVGSANLVDKKPSFKVRITQRKNAWGHAGDQTTYRVEREPIWTEEP